MLRKVLAGALVMIIVGSYSTIGYSVGDNIEIENNNAKVVFEENVINIIYPEDNLITTDNIVLLSGRAKEGLKIVVEVYSSVNFTGIDFDINTSLINEESDEEREEFDKELGIELREVLENEEEQNENKKENKENMENMEEMYVLESKEIFEVGELGVFAKELMLKPGKNKICIYVIDKEHVETIIKYVYVTDIEKIKEYVNSIGDMNFSETIKQIINSSSDQDTSTFPFWR